MNSRTMNFVPRTELAMNTKILGNYGETLAEDYLQSRGYQILEKNYRNKLGEIDLVAKDHHCLCFIEVKTREGCEVPQEAVSRRKQSQLTKMAYVYLKERLKTVDVSCRFDVVAISRDNSGEAHIHLIQNAFNACF